MSAVGAGTRVTAVLGDPVRHSLSPVLLNTAFAATGLDWVMAAFEISQPAAPAAAAGIRALGLAGASVTYPLKAAFAGLVDRLEGDAARLGAVNNVRWDGDHLVGCTTDGDGFVRSLRADAIEPAGATCVVLGAGGAAGSIVLALLRAGADVRILNRTGAAARALADLTGGAAAVADLADLAAADLVVNATTVGMTGGPPGSPVDATALRSGQIVVDIVYHPLETPLLEAARLGGCRTIGGIGMLVHQAAIQFELWTGTPAPVAPMRDALGAALTRR